MRKRTPSIAICPKTFYIWLLHQEAHGGVCREAETLKLSQDLERQKAEKSALNDEDQQPSFDPVNDSLATDDMDLGGTGNVRIGSVDSPMLKKYKKERDARGNQEKDEGEKSSAKPSAYERTASQRSTFSDMGNVFRMPVDVSPLPSPNKYDTGRKAKECLCELRQ